MRQILVDLDVYAAIWAARAPPEEAENDVLRRILLDLVEVKTSNTVGIAQPIVQTEEVRMGSPHKIRWIDDVLDAFRRLGGEADLAAIYKSVESIRKARGAKQIKTLEATVRRAIEEHSSDSENFGRNVSAPDHFSKVGRGRWRLRSNG